MQVIRLARGGGRGLNSLGAVTTRMKYLEYLFIFESNRIAHFKSPSGPPLYGRVDAGPRAEPR